MAALRRIHFHNTVTDFLEEHVFQNDADFTTLIICSTRDHFAKRLFAALQTETTATQREQQQEHENNSSNTTNFQRQPSDESVTTKPGSNSSLLSKTIGLLAKSNRIKLAFCPTLESLRAYLSSFQIITGSSERTVSREQHSTRPVLGILDLLGLHYLTSEFSAQGLSRTLASAVEAAAREGAGIVLIECADAVHPAGGKHGEELWCADVPLLSNSVRTDGAEATPTGHCVPLGRVVQRWFDIHGCRSRETGLRDSGV